MVADEDKISLQGAGLGFCVEFHKVGALAAESSVLLRVRGSVPRNKAETFC